MAKQDKRARTARRQRERSLRKLVRDREKLAALEPGGSPERPLEVPSPAVIDGRVRATRCVQCEGDLELRGDAVERHGEELLRVVHVRCRRCHVPRSIWFRLAPPQPN